MGGTAVERLIDDDALYRKAWEHVRCAGLEELSKMLCAAKMDDERGLLLAKQKKMEWSSSRCVRTTARVRQWTSTSWAWMTTTTTTSAEPAEHPLQPPPFEPTRHGASK